MRGLLISKHFDLEWLQKWLPDPYIYVEKVYWKSQISPNHLLLFIQIPVNVEMWEVSWKYWNKVIISIIYKNELQSMWYYLYLICAQDLCFLLNLCLSLFPLSKLCFSIYNALDSLTGKVRFIFFFLMRLSKPLAAHQIFVFYLKRFIILNIS